MTDRIFNLGQSSEEAFRVFHTFDDGMPELTPTGLTGLDEALGGLFPGTCGILASATNVGKSRLALTAALSSGVPTGIISMEDTPDVVGSRALAWASGVNSRKIRKKELTPADREALSKGKERLEQLDVLVAYQIGSKLDEVLDAANQLMDRGCKILWLDYLQKIRGLRDDRRSEVGEAFTAYQRTCDRGGAVSMVISQFARQPDMTRPPQIFWLKESGDLENEARVIVLCHEDPADPGTVVCRVGKSTFGGGGTEFRYRTGESGMLYEVEEEEDF